MPEVAALASLPLQAFQTVKSLDAQGQASKLLKDEAAAQAAAIKELNEKKKMHGLDLIAGRFRSEMLSRQRREQAALGTFGTQTTGAYGLTGDPMRRMTLGV